MSAVDVHSVNVTSLCSITPSALRVRIKRAVSNVDTDSRKKEAKENRHVCETCALCVRYVCVPPIFLDVEVGLVFRFLLTPFFIPQGKLFTHMLSHVPVGHL